MKRLAARLLSGILAVLMILVLLPTGVKADVPSLRVGSVSYYSTSSPDQIINDSYYYSDDWFFMDPPDSNGGLALVSMQLTAAAVDGQADGLGTVFLNELGFEETGYESCDPDDLAGCNYTWGRKTITNGEETAELIAVQIQSYSFDREVKKTGWSQNFLVNGEEPTVEHFGFYQAVSNALPDIAALADSANAIFWVTGHSRGGALANMVAAELGRAGNTVYAYTFEAPAVTEGYAAKECSYIHNYISSDDMVTMLPPWGMARNGAEYILNTPEADAQLAEALQKLGSSLTESLEVYQNVDVESRAQGIMDVLTERIPTREEYSAVQTDTFTDEEGNEVEITYVYQDICLKLMEVIFGDALEGIDTTGLFDNIGVLLPVAESLIRAVREDSVQDYYAAALGLSAFLPEMGIALPFSEDELYAVLKLAGPVLIDASYEPENDPAGLTDMLGYLTPALLLYAEKDALTFSHQFEVVLARLKAIAPAPEYDSLDIVIDDPAVGDDLLLAPAAIVDYVDSLGNEGITASGKWESDDEVLEDGKVYYLSSEIRVTGYALSEDFSVTLNGLAPVEEPSVSFKDGIYTISAVWQFTFGSPELVTVTFDTAGRADVPEPVLVSAGSRLGYVITPVSYGTAEEGGKKWQFNGWKDADGQSWEDVIADEDLTLYADWSSLIDKIELTYTIPHVGGELGTPAVPENAGYKIDEVIFVDEHWDTVTTVDSTGSMEMNCRILPASEKYIFALETDEDGYMSYTGTCTVNGEPAEVYFEKGYLDVYYGFDPLPAGDEPTPTPGDGTVTPTPDDGTVTPTPGDGTVTPTPGDGTVTPTPGDGTITPTPDDGTITPTPGSGTKIPTPTGGKTNPTPSGKTAAPTPTKRPAVPTASAGIRTTVVQRTVTQAVSSNTSGTGKNTSSAKDGTVRTTSVKTGDESDPALWLSLLTAAAVGLILCVSFGRKKM